MTRFLSLNSDNADLYTFTTPSHILRTAMTHIDTPEGWAQGQFFVGSGSCALGAIHKASNVNMLALEILDYRLMMDTLVTVLKENHPDVVATEVPDFNDDPSVTYQDIVAAFTKAALKLEEQGK